MKNYLKHISMVLFAGLTFTACETTDLDLRVSPNDLAADQADPNLLLNSIQLAYASNMDAISDLGAELTRIDYMFGRDYFNNYPGDTFNGIWSRTYSSGFNDPGNEDVQVGMFTNINTLETIDAESDTDYSFHLGVSKTLQAHMLMLLVDYLGEAAFSQFGNPDEFPAPTLDDGASVYAAALGLLD
ncbi:MAG: SusD/RagB family nutrient-binding outer membrane lipoprotein, partial [Muricauda sp.]